MLLLKNLTLRLLILETTCLKLFPSTLCSRLKLDPLGLKEVSLDLRLLKVSSLTSDVSSTITTVACPSQQLKLVSVSEMKFTLSKDFLELESLPWLKLSTS